MNRRPRPEAEFYIGYQAQTPPGLARFYRRGAAILLVATAGLGALLAGLMRPLPPSFFDFGHARDFEGLVQEAPYPSLLVTDGIRSPGSPPDAAPLPRVLLGGEGKHGAQDLVRGLDGARVRLTGTLAWRPAGTGASAGASMGESTETTTGPQGFIEIQAGSVRTLAPAATAAANSRSGGSGRRIRLRGEIMDAKCYLGVMNPGESTVHRDCAALCIRGGLPALFVARDDRGVELGLLLADENGRAMAGLLPPLVGLPLSLDGTLLDAGPDGFGQLRVARRRMADLAAAQSSPTSAFTPATIGSGWWCRLTPAGTGRNPKRMGALP